MMTASTAPLPAVHPAVRLATAAFLALGAAWLWFALCRFTGTAWNDIRLVPAFMLAHGEPVYPPPGIGVISTWMYGPLPLVLLWPATLMPTIGSALLAAGALNIVIALATLGIACAWWPASSVGRAERWLAFGVGVLLWPESNLRYLQADNAAVLFGLVSLLLLARQRPGSLSSAAAWGSAIAAVAALACKQVAIGPAAAGLLWLGLGGGWSAAARQLLRLAAVAAAAGILALSLADPAGLWLALVVVPRGLPWVDDAGERLRQLASGLAIAGGLPLLVLLIDRARWWSRGTAPQLAAIAWAACLPLGLLAAFKTGGSINSFHGYLLVLPALLLELAGRPRLRFGLIIGALALFAMQAWPARNGPWRPTLDPAQEAVALAQAAPSRVWFPWHPLVSWYAESRFHHAEDGMYARFMAGQPLPFPHVRSRLPDDFSAMAMPTGFSDWGIASSLIPPNATRSTEGSWQVWRWDSPRQESAP